MGFEAQIERRFCRRIESELGLTQTKFVTPGQTGWPDRIIWMPGGRPVLIEFKAPGEKPEPLQALRHERLRRLGYIVEVHDDFDTAFNSITHHLEVSRESRKNQGGEGSRS